MRKQVKTRPKYKIIIFLLVALFISLAIWKVLIPVFQTNQRKHLATPKFSTTNEALISNKGLNSTNAILIRRSDGKILMEKNSNQKMYPASMTKIMTVMVALENIYLPDQRVTLTSDIFDFMKRENASIAGFSAGEKVRAIDLMYGAILPSGGECCIGLAKAVSGSEDKFADKMNEQAKKLGMTNTHFVNSIGLQNKEHYSTVKDVALLLDYSLQDSTFKKIFTSHTHKTSRFDYKNPGGITFNSTLFDVKNKVHIPNGQVLGGKTGFTDKAGYCLASLAVINGEEYILVTANAPQSGQNIADALRVYSKL